MCAAGHLVTVYALSAYVFKRHLANVENATFIEKLKLFVVGAETTCRVQVVSDHLLTTITSYLGRFGKNGKPSRHFDLDLLHGEYRLCAYWRHHLGSLPVKLDVSEHGDLGQSGRFVWLRVHLQKFYVCAFYLNPLAAPGLQ